jgi:nucleotide-binding universal stress UspA family protein
MSVAIQHGDPARVILLHANARQCDLIVLGTHRRTGFDRLRSGSVAEQVTRRAGCPVLVVPMRPDGATREFAGSFRNLVCPVDFSAASQTALAQALRLADETESRLTLVHVLPPLESMRASDIAWRVKGPEYGRLLKRDAWQRLQNVVPPQARAVTNVHARLVSGAPADAIARVASDIDADLIVMGLTARGMMGRTLFGSTAVRVLRSAGRPMLIVPARMQRPMVPAVATDLATAKAA